MPDSTPPFRTHHSHELVVLTREGDGQTGRWGLRKVGVRMRWDCSFQKLVPSLNVFCIWA